MKYVWWKQHPELIDEVSDTILDATGYNPYALFKCCNAWNKGLSVYHCERTSREMASMKRVLYIADSDVIWAMIVICGKSLNVHVVLGFHNYPLALYAIFWKIFWSNLVDAHVSVNGVKILIFNFYFVFSIIWPEALAYAWVKLNKRKWPPFLSKYNAHRIYLPWTHAIIKSSYAGNILVKHRPISSLCFDLDSIKFFVWISN